MLKNWWNFINKIKTPYTFVKQANFKKQSAYKYSLFLCWLLTEFCSQNKAVLLWAHFKIYPTVSQLQRALCSSTVWRQWSSSSSTSLSCEAVLSSGIIEGLPVCRACIRHNFKGTTRIEALYYAETLAYLLYFGTVSLTQYLRLIVRKNDFWHFLDLWNVKIYDGTNCKLGKCELNGLNLATELQIYLMSFWRYWSNEQSTIKNIFENIILWKLLSHKGLVNRAKP